MKKGNYSNYEEVELDENRLQGKLLKVGIRRTYFCQYWEVIIYVFIGKMI
jgi:hypothetical protein